MRSSESSLPGPRKDAKRWPKVSEKSPHECCLGLGSQVVRLAIPIFAAPLHPQLCMKPGAFKAWRTSAAPRPRSGLLAEGGLYEWIVGIVASLEEPAARWQPIVCKSLSLSLLRVCVCVHMFVSVCVCLSLSLSFSLSLSLSLLLAHTHICRDMYIYIYTSVIICAYMETPGSSSWQRSCVPRCWLSGDPSPRRTGAAAVKLQPLV